MSSETLPFPEKQQKVQVHFISNWKIGETKVVGDFATSNEYSGITIP